MPSDVPPSLSRSAGLALAIFTGLNLLNFADRYVMPAILSPMKADLGFDDFQAGWGLAAFMIGYFLSAPVFGYLGDIYSRKKLMLMGVLVWSLATAATAAAHDLASLMTIRIFVGVGEACFSMISPAWISDLFPVNRRNNALAIYSAATPFGSALGYVIGGWFGQHGWWREAFFCAGLPGVLLVLTLLFLQEPVRGQSDGVNEETAAHQQASLAEFWMILSNIRFILLTGGYASLIFSIGAFGSWGPEFLQKIHHMRVDEANTVFGAMLAGVGTVGTLVGGALSTYLRRFLASGYAWVLTLSLALAIPVSLLAFLTPDRLTSQIAIGGCMFLLFLPTAPCLSQLFEIVPIHDRAKANAVLTFFLHLLGDFPSPIIVGFISAYYGGLRSGVLILPFVLILGTVLWYILLRYCKKGLVI